VEGLPQGTVTFFFTDLAVSTRLWDRESDEMSDALARHDAILRESIAAHGGNVVKGRGDGVHAVFATADAAVRAAVACQASLGEVDWPVSEPLLVRIGIHTGVAELRDDDYFGSAVNRAARLEAIAHGGQIVCSQATADLARDSVSEGIVFVDLGEHRLRDLTRPERVFQVGAPGLLADFPPLRSLDAFTTNLTPQRTSFVGRGAEVAAVMDALADARLVTLTGVGGVGKTRLAVHVAADMLAEFPDGVWLVELAAIGDPDAVPDAVLTTVGLVQQPGRTVTASIAEAFAGRRSLLVLDNCEHVLDAAAELVEALLARGGHAKVLATSREGLRVADERLWPVPSLGGRDGSGSDAVALFVERARAVAPSFDLGAPGTSDAVDEICGRLDGIPLAIELAAARTIAMSAPEIRDRLDDRFRLLAGSRRGLERHQTLRHAVQWSYDLLEPEERQLLNRCSVFAGGFDLHAATAIAGDGDDEYTVLDVLEALVRKSLVDADQLSGYTRYTLLETIRQFAEEQLAETVDIADVRALHARYYAARSVEVLSWWTDGPRNRDMYAWFKTELANLRVAVHTAADGGALDSAATIAVSAAVLAAWTEQFEAATWAEELLDAAQAVDHPQLAALYAAASLCAATGRAEDGLRYADMARELFEDDQYARVPFGSAGSFLAYPYLFSGRPEDWLEFCRAEAERAVDDPLDLSTVLVLALSFTQRHDEATVLATEVLRAAEATGSPSVLNAALTAFHYAYFDRDLSAAIGALRRSVAISQDLGISVGHTASMLARAEAAHGDAGAALVACQRALLAYTASGDIAGARTPLAVLAGLLHQVGRHEPAALLAGAAEYAGMAAYPDLVAMIEDIRESAGADTFDALADRGRSMENTAVFRYALEQIDDVRADFDGLVDIA
jgi:predicted ATPase/class 3 adenylate cyclase